MLCECCGSDKHWIKDTYREQAANGKHTATCDTRIYTCKVCSLRHVTECRPVFVDVYDAENMVKLRVTLEEYRRVWVHLDRLKLRDFMRIKEQLGLDL